MILKIPKIDKVWQSFVIGFIAVTVGYAAFLYTGSTSLCVPNEVCLREWVSALSGYFALAAALVTITVMNRQRREALEIQKENVALTIMGRLALANNYRLEASSASVISGQYPWVNSAQAPGSTFYDQRYVDLRRVIDILNRPSISRFEVEIGGTVATAALVPLPFADKAATLDRLRRQIPMGSAIPTELSDQSIQEAYNIAFGQCYAYATIGENAAAAFIQKWSDRIA